MLAPAALEEWRSIKGFSNYEVSNLGRVRSLPRTYKLGYEHRGVLHNAGGQLRTSIVKGTLRVSMGTTRANRKYYGVKKLVWEAFYGELRRGVVLLSEDGDPANAALTNLRPVTRAELLRMNVR